MSDISAANKRKIKLNDKWSDDESLDLIMAGNTPIPVVTSKVSTVDIEAADGSIDTSRASGRLHFNPIVITYNFTHEILRYDPETKIRYSVPEMNQKVKEHVSTVQNWVYDPESYDYNPSGQVLVAKDISKFYDTGLCDPDTKTGYWLPNPRCTNFSVNKVLSSDMWVIQYTIEITTDPYMYEYDADPKTYAMFSGPTADGYGMGKVSVKIFSEPQSSGATVDIDTRMRRYLWTNDNRDWLLTSTVSKSDSTYATSLTFKPSVVPVYTGKIGVYINFYVEYTYNGTTYNYHVTNAYHSSGTYEFIESDKLATAKEMGITDQNGMTLTLNITDDSGNLDSLLNMVGNKLPIAVIWGTIKTFTTKSAREEFMVVGHGPTNSFQKITGASAGSIYSETKKFGEAFKFDNDAYNELIMNSTSYGVYSLESTDNARRTI